MTRKSQPTQIESRILVVCPSSAKWQISKSKCFNKFALLWAYLRYTFFRGCSGDPSNSDPIVTRLVGILTPEVWASEPFVPRRILWINTEKM